MYTLHINNHSISNSTPPAIYRFLNSTLVLDVDSGTWNEQAVTGTLPSPRVFHSAVVLGHQMYVVGGKGAKDISGFVLDLRSWVWSKIGWRFFWSFFFHKGSAPTSRFGASLTATSSTTAFLAGGMHVGEDWNSETKFCTDNWTLTKETDGSWKWAQVGELESYSNDRAHAGPGVLHNGSVYLFGGECSADGTDSNHYHQKAIKISPDDGNPSFVIDDIKHYELGELTPGLDNHPGTSHLLPANKVVVVSQGGAVDVARLIEMMSSRSSLAFRRPTMKGEPPDNLQLPSGSSVLIDERWIVFFPAVDGTWESLPVIDTTPDLSASITSAPPSPGLAGLNRVRSLTSLAADAVAAGGSETSDGLYIAALPVPIAECVWDQKVSKGQLDEAAVKQFLHGGFTSIVLRDQPTDVAVLLKAVVEWHGEYVGNGGSVSWKKLDLSGCWSEKLELLFESLGALGMIEKLNFSDLKNGQGLIAKVIKAMPQLVVLQVDGYLEAGEAEDIGDELAAALSSKAKPFGLVTGPMVLLDELDFGEAPTASY